MECIPVQEPQWFVMRDFAQASRNFSYKSFEEAGFRVFTPLTWQLVGRGGARERMLAPFIRDLFFVCSTRELLDPMVLRSPVVTYRYVRGGYHRPMVVPSAEMDRFIRAVESCVNPVYYRPDEVTPAMYGSRVRIVGGHLDGYEGLLVESCGGRKGKWLLVELPGFFSVGVKVQPRYVRLVNER